MVALGSTARPGVLGQEPESATDVQFEIYRVLVDDFPLLVRSGETATPPLGRRNLQFYYGIAGALPSDTVEYRFRMEGMEQNWVDAGDRTIAFYRHIEPGTYAFVAEAREAGGRWTRRASIPIYVPTYFYETTWFYLLATGAFAALIGMLFWIERRRGRVQNQKLAVLVDERTRELQEENERAEAALEEARAARAQAEATRAEADDARAEAERARAEAEAILATTEEQALQLLRVDHLKSRLFANLSHEFRTPLTLILDPLERAVRGELGDLDDLDGYATHVLDVARLNAVRLLRLINQLLDLSKLEGGGMELRAHEHDLVAFLQKATDLFGSEAERLGVRLLFRPETERLPLYVDTEKLEKIVFNLLSNALKADADGGKVLVSVRLVPPAEPTGHVFDLALAHDRMASLVRSGYAEISVRDTGVGIEPEQVAHIFDRFYQARSGKTGTGIGLSLVKELVDLHRGVVSVDSQPGFGSTFTVRLPLGTSHLAAHEVVAPGDEPEPFSSRDLLPEEPLLATQSLPTTPAALPAPESQPALPSAPPDGPAPLILVVDDHAELRVLINSHLAADYRLIEAANGEQALRSVYAYRPDLVISDIIMPGMSGLDLCAKIRADEDLASTPVILLTARGGDESRIHGYDTGADEYLTKPFLGEELRVRIANLLRRRQTMRERYSQELVLEPLNRPVQSADAAFVERVYETIEDHLGDTDFTVGALAEGVGLSESQLKRKLRAILDRSPVEVIRTYRLERAAKLLRGHAGGVSEIAYRVGFNSVSYFSKTFREHTGQLPSEVLAEAEPDEAEAAEHTD